jgi:hypothetical protein
MRGVFSLALGPELGDGDLVSVAEAMAQVFRTMEMRQGTNSAQREAKLT